MKKADPYLLFNNILLLPFVLKPNIIILHSGIISAADISVRGRCPTKPHDLIFFHKKGKRTLLDSIVIQIALNKMLWINYSSMPGSRMLKLSAHLRTFTSARKK